jgi:phosphoserine phosphatase
MRNNAQQEGHAMPTIPVQRRPLFATLLAGIPASAAAQPGASDPLPSWREGAAKRAILDFLSATTTEGAPDFVGPAERVAVFDNDGTLWPELPMITQILFALDRVRALAPQNPGWAEREPFRSILAGDMAGAARSGEAGLAEVIAATHTGMTPEAFGRTVLDWLASAQHPRFGRPFTDCVYQPMLEVLALFRTRGFRTFIVSGGTTEFIRAWAEQAYGILPEQVVGTTFAVRYERTGSRGELLTLPSVDFVNEGPGKAIGMSRIIGRRPVAAFGNSDGDYEMLEYATTGPGRRLGVFVHHDDAGREYAYDRGAPIGALDRGLTDAPRQGWNVV